VSVSAHTYTASLGSRALSVTGGTISLDDSRSPHVEATLTIPFPGAWSTMLWDDPTVGGFDEEPFGVGPFGAVNPVRQWDLDEAALSAMDPRKPARVVFTADVTTETYSHVRRFDLALRTRKADHEAGTVTLGLASDEALLEDWSPMADDKRPFARRASMRSIVNYVLGKVIPGASLAAGSSDHSFSGTDSDVEAFTWKAGQSAMDFLRPLVQAGGLRLVCDELRGWTLRSANYTTGGAITITQGENAIAGSESISRDDDAWFDAAVTRYRWTDRNGQQQERYDSYALRTAYRRVRTFEKDTPYPGPGFSAYAVRRAQGRGREGVASAVADWRAHAEMPVVINLDGSPTQSGRIARVEFDLDRDEMTVTARTIDTPPTAWLFLPAGEKWSDSPVGASWTGEEA